MQNQAAALAGGRAEEFESAALAEQAACRRPASEDILAGFTRKILDLNGLQEFDGRIEVAAALELRGFEHDSPGGCVIGGSDPLIEAMLQRGYPLCLRGELAA